MKTIIRLKIVEEIEEGKLIEKSIVISLELLREKIDEKSIVNALNNATFFNEDPEDIDYIHSMMSQHIPEEIKFAICENCYYIDTQKFGITRIEIGHIIKFSGIKFRFLGIEDEND